MCFPQQWLAVVAATAPRYCEQMQRLVVRPPGQKGEPAIVPLVLGDQPH